MNKPLVRLPAGAKLDRDERDYIKKAKLRLFKRRLIDSNGCWLWTGALDTSGYGQIRFKDRLWLVHRLSLMLLRPEEYREGSMVLHKCDVEKCFNPEHLFSGNGQDNMRDLVEKGLHYQTKKNTCPQGHPYDEENTYHHPSGERRCKICIRKNSYLRSITI